MYAFPLLVLTLSVTTEAAKILAVFPTPSISHQVIFRPLIQELIKRHEVVVMTTDPAFPKGHAPSNLTEIDVQNVSYQMWERVYTEIDDNKLTDILPIMTVAFRVLSNIFEEQLKNKDMQKLINENVKFDLLLIEACVIPALSLSHVFKAPVILVSSFGAIPGNMETVGAVTHPFLYPTHYHQRLYNLTILEKVGELYNHVMFDLMLREREKEDDKMLKKVFWENFPPLSELKDNVHMLFLNVHSIWLDNQPVPPSVLHIWGLHQIPEKKLPVDLESFLISSKNGVIYISFGTNVKASSLAPDKLKILTTVLSKCHYDVLWKWNLDELPGRSENIRISKWFPQPDILRHPKLKLFITQGGLQSTEEAINATVPLIGIPMFADQGYNTAKYEHFKIGLKLDLESLTEERLETAINTVIEDERYRENIIRLRTLMYDQPQSPLERAVWWTEHVLRHGGAKHLRAPAANMPWNEYYQLELVLVFILCLILSIFIPFILLYISYIFFCYTGKVKVL